MSKADLGIVACKAPMGDISNGSVAQVMSFIDDANWEKADQLDFDFM